VGQQQATPFQKPSPYLRSLAQNMMTQGSNTAPVRSPLEGLARALTGLAGGYFAGQANEQQQGYDEAKGGRLASLLGMSPDEAQGLSSEELLAVGTLGETRKAARAKAEAGEAKEGFSQEKNLRKEYSDLSKPFRDIRSNYSRVVESAKNPSKAGDIALIFSFMKSLDPGSTVREGEFATARDAGSIAESVIATYNSLVTGKSMLAPNVRRDFVDRASRLYASALDSQQSLEEEYGGLAGQYGLDRNRILPDYVRGLEPVNVDEFMPVDPGQTEPQVPAADAGVTGDGGDGVTVPEIGTADAYNALPSGTKYRKPGDPIGRVRTKK